MIKTLIFDLGNVLVPLDFTRCYAQLERLSPHPPAEIVQRLMASDLARRFETGSITPEDFVPEVCRALELRVGYPEFCELWSSIFLPESLIPESMLAALRERYRLLLLSNTNLLHFNAIRQRYPLLRHLHHFVLSYEVGAMKPSATIYQEAVRHAGCRAGECFFTDDIPAYVEGARSHGIDAVRFTGLEQLQHDLHARGIRWD
jgi:glucose-1-phosphatase